MSQVYSEPQGQVRWGTPSLGVADLVPIPPPPLADV